MSRFFVARAFVPGSDPQYLRLDGPFAYARWTYSPENATPLPLGAATSWVEALKFGPDDRAIRAIPAADVMRTNGFPLTAVELTDAEKHLALAARAPDTKREGWSPFSGILGAEGTDE